MTSNNNNTQEKENYDWAFVAFQNGDIKAGKLSQINTSNGTSMYKLELTNHDDTLQIDYELFNLDDIRAIKISSQNELDMVYSNNKNEHQIYKYPVLHL